MSFFSASSTAVLLLLLNMGAFSQKIFVDSLLVESKLVYDFRFLSADSAIQKVNSNSSHLNHLLAANYYWWQIISGHDLPEYRNRYYHHLDTAHAFLNKKKAPSCSNDTLYSRITTFAYKARLHAMNSKYFAALAQLNNCMEYVQKSFGKENEFEWFCLTSGLYNYYINAVKKNYPFLLPYLVFLPSGNSVKGIELLNRASQSENPLLSTEADYFLMKIYLEEEKNFSGAEIYAQRLVNKYPSNLLYRYYLFKILLQSKQITEAKKELGMLQLHAQKNDQLSQAQKMHFVEIAKGDLKEYFLDRKNPR